ncbi:CS domain containing protein [Trichomonas vaginalis G3]|uniref:CS domain containing protein n=1 Tax=Trichomonas vaginalis (strain ATCC PRA-98 / G3) TaxID=412133 RepID=A2FH89_TRIV3|nr:SGT1-like protein family [Trichomonas vaginalis G3]EAX95727.1 CS domain containing protein [Trichomonas vaginalis G3]KAI5549315.1 SGT1-like protein family [Trichomonas vaginalis G3]|eukprot:XP_001308657.1 CS domain containing protein [Trichomonas vaginalis G3]
MDSSALAQTTDDNISAHMLKGNYEIAIILLDQLRKETKVLSHSNEIKYINCLYHMHRYLEALENIKRINESGKFIKELHFMKGVCLYKLNKYMDAEKIFLQHTAWARWINKTNFQLAVEMDAAQFIELGEPIQHNLLSNTKNEWYQSNDYITNTIFVKGLTKNQVSVTFYPFSVDVIIRASNKETLTKSFELYGEIIPKECETKVTPIKIELKMKKKVHGNWPTRDADLEVGLHMDDQALFNSLTEIEDIPDTDALKAFEQKQTETTGIIPAPPSIV